MTRRWSWFPVALPASMVGLADVARADGPWPALSPEWIARGAGGGLAILPMVCWWGWVAAWAFTTDWIYRDSRQEKIRPEWWTAWSVFPFAVCGLLAWFIPGSALVAALIGQVLMAAAWLVPLFLYGMVRNPKVPESRRIFTVGHARRTAIAALKAVGIKVAAKVEASDGLPRVLLVATSGENAEENRNRLVEVMALPGYAAAVKLLQEAIYARASTLLLEIAPTGVISRHDVDGIVGAARSRKPGKGFGKSKQPDSWEDAPPLEAAVGNAALAVLRTIAAADASKRNGEPSAAFAVEVNGKKRSCRLSSRATKTSKLIVVDFETPPFPVKKLEDLGMSSGVANRVRELIALEKGLFLVSSPPAAGCTTSFDTVLLTADRLLRDFVSIEDVAAPGKEIQNVKPIRYNAAGGESAVAALKQAMLEYPRAIVTRDLTDGDLASALIDLADDQQMLVIVSVRAADAISAIQKLLDLGVDREKLAHCLLGSLAGRMVRMLCPDCGEPVATPEDMLKRLGKTIEELPEIKRRSSLGGCRGCAGRMYVGRTAVFELASGPTLRQVLAKPADPKLLQQAANKDGMQSLTKEGRGLIAAHVTSPEELQRVFAVKTEAGKPGVRR
ncbi:MAG: Flp pilus assembly complex ATPase component TadA [Planctomycetes bacterium]|nr:Flp pilus assembly complex ATPase component TadA [Planctomycetota bacterium]